MPRDATLIYILTIGQKCKDKVMAKMVLRESVRISPEPQCVLIGKARVVHTAQGRSHKGRLDIWFEIDADYERTLDEASRFVFVVATGQRISDDYTHIGTVVCDNDLVWHIYVESAL